MKLKYGQTVRIGFAFLAICAFWQMYNNVIPLMLTNTFQMSETWSGMIMAADNVFAVFLLPFFGNLSDRCTSSLGKRKPYILAGTILSVILMMFLPFLDNRYAASPAGILMVLFVAVLCLLLFSMGTYRSPAVALMPDVTPKPLRSRGNAVINLMGAIGGIVYLIIAAVLYPESRTRGAAHVDYFPLFLFIAAIMIIALFIVLFTIDENRLAREARSFNEKYDAEEEKAAASSVSPHIKRSLLFLLLSVFFWFTGYNAVETWFTVYAQKSWGMGIGSASLCLTIATGGAILSYMPVAAIASKIGRKKTILLGVALLCASFFSMFLYSAARNSFHPALYALFCVIGFSWAAINVNSLPMVLEMCKDQDIGKFTGYYYAFSMSAQIVTPVLAGFLLNRAGYHSLFPYSAAFSLVALLTMLFVKHGDTRNISKKGLEAFDVED
ncbi:MAG: MFS transporter [Blautia sp.]|nr:MFS transporter [Blautia sp.]